MFEQTLKTIKNRFLLPLPHTLNATETEWFKKYITGRRDKLDKLVTGLPPSDTNDFLNRWESTKSTYEKIKSTDDTDEIIKHLNTLKLFLEIEASKPTTFLGPATGPDGTTARWWISRDKQIDAYFEERVLSIVRQSIIDLTSLQQVNPQSNRNEDGRYKNFLDEVATIESGFGDKGTLINPTFYAPIATLWKSVESDKIKQIRDTYRKEVQGQVDFAGEVANMLINKYQIAVTKQPERQLELVIEFRDRYVNQLAEKYAPIENWFYGYWDEAKQNVEKINDLESEVFQFCYSANKPFMVGRELIKCVFGLGLAVELLNKMLNTVAKEPLKENVRVQNEETTPLEDQPKMFIVGHMQTRLFKTLSDSTPLDQHEALEKLLSEGFIDNRIWVKLRADSLVYIFKQARAASTSAITADMRQTARWLAAYFNYAQTAPRAVSEATAYNVMRGNIEVKKNNQIRLKV